MTNRTLYFRLLAFLLGPAVDVVKQFFEIYVLKPSYNSQLVNFLNALEHKHELFHALVSNLPCCECKATSMTKQRNKGFERIKFKVLFDDSGENPHEKKKGKARKHCLCKFSAKTSIILDKLDITLLYYLMQKCCPSQLNNNSFLTIKDLRNKLFHRGNVELELNEFESIWKSLETATLDIARDIGSISVKMFQREIDDLKDSPFEKLKDMIDNLQKDTKNVLQSVNRLGSMIAPSDMLDTEDSTSIQTVKREITDEENCEEIFVSVNNIRCLLKLNGLPYDLHQTESENCFPEVKGNGLLYVEWTIDCPKKWNTAMIASDINDNLSDFQEEFCIDYVYIETNSRLMIHSTSQSFVFRSFSVLEVAVQRLLVNIVKVCNLKSNDLEDFVASLLIMTKPDEGDELHDDKCTKKSIKDQSMIGLKDDFVTCEHCTKSFSCYKCMSNIRHISTLNQALRMKELTIQRLEKTLVKREEGIIEVDESDKESYYSDNRNNIVTVDGSDKESFYSVDKNNITTDDESDKETTYCSHDKRNIAIDKSEVESSSSFDKDNTTEIFRKLVDKRPNRKKQQTLKVDAGLSNIPALISKQLRGKRKRSTSLVDPRYYKRAFKISSSSESDTAESEHHRRRSRRTIQRPAKFCGKSINHEWIVDENLETKQWYTGIVLSVLSGTDGDLDAVYEVQYEDDEVYEVDHLVQDYQSGSAEFYYA